MESKELARVHTKSSVYLKYLPDELLFSACGFLSWLNPRLQLHLFYCMLSINMDLSYGVNVFVPMFRFLLFVFFWQLKSAAGKK